MMHIPSLSRHFLAPALLSLGMMTLAHAQALAETPNTGMPDCPHMGSDMGPHMHGSMMGDGMMGPGMMGPGMRMGHGMGYFQGGMAGMGPSYLRGLQLSEEQQDRIFNIMHKQEPRHRESVKLLHKSMASLHQLTHAGNYTDANAQSLARSIGQASADLALQHVQTERQILEVLTPEQRRQLEERGSTPRIRPGCPVAPGVPGPRR